MIHIMKMFSQAGVEQCGVLDGVGTDEQPYTWRPGLLSICPFPVYNNDYHDDDDN